MLFNYRKLTNEESINLSMRLHQEARYLSEKKHLEKQLFLENNYSFKPNIHNKEAPKAENFFIRLQDWIEQTHENSIR